MKNLDNLSDENKQRIVSIINIIIDKSELREKDSLAPYKIMNDELRSYNVLGEDLHHFIKILNESDNINASLENDIIAKRFDNNPRSIKSVRYDASFPESLNIKTLEDLKKCTVIRVYNLDNLLKIKKRLEHQINRPLKQIIPSNEKESINVDFREYEKRTILKIGKLLPIEFEKMPALIIKYLYDAYKLDNTYKSYKDFNGRFKAKIDSNAFRQDINNINDRIKNHTSKQIKEIIKKEEGIRNNINRYKWYIRT